MNFAFGDATELYSSKIHPRIILGPDDVPQLRDRLTQGDGKTVLDAFRKRIAPAIDTTLGFATDAELVDYIGAPRTLGYTQVINQSYEMAFLARLDEDDRGLDAARRVLRVATAVEGGEAQSRLRLGYACGGDLALAYDLVADRLTVAERTAVTAWLYKGGIAATLEQLGLTYCLQAGRNIPMVGLFSAIQAMLAIDGDPGVPDLSETWQDVMTRFEATLNTVVGRDGYPAEDTGYGTLMMAQTMIVGEALRRAGKLDPWTVAPRYGSFGDAILHLVQPWGEDLTTTGDHGDDFGKRILPLLRSAAENANPALIWLAGTLRYPTRGEAKDVRLHNGVRVENSMYSLLFAEHMSQARHPRDCDIATSYCDRDRGVVSFRSGWDDDDTYLFFDGSQRNNAAQGHEHASCGQFCLSALGDYFAVGPGRYNNEQSCQSVVLINGHSGRSTNGEWRQMFHHGRLTAYAPGEFVDSAAVDSSHQHNVYWAFRTVGLVKGKGPPSYVWILDDINACNDWTEYWWQLHTSPENTIAITGSSATIAGWRSGNLLDVHFVLPPPGVYPKPHTLRVTQDEAFPSSTAYVSHAQCREHVTQFTRPAEQIHYSTFVRPRLLGKIKGYNGRFATLLLPRHHGTTPAQIEQLHGIPGTLGVRIHFGDVIDTLVWSFDHNMLVAGSVDGRGKWCVIRQATDSGDVLNWQMDGDRLCVGGVDLS